MPITPLALTSILAAASSAIPGDYAGKFAAHPNLARVQEIAQAVAKDAPGDLPKWVAKKTPSITVELVDAKEPLPDLTWPGHFQAAFELSDEKKGWSATIQLPIDSLIHDPRLVEPALRRQIFGVAAFKKELESGVSLMDVGKQGLTNPLVDAMAAHWAGSLEMEIGYGLSRHLHDDEKVAALVSELTLTSNGSALEERPVGDLTLLMLARVLAPKKDKKLGTLFESILRKQPLKGGLKKASGKSLERLNDALRKAFKKDLDRLHPKNQRDAYREAYEAYQAKRWEEVKEAKDRVKLQSAAGANMTIFIAVALAKTETALEIPEETGVASTFLRAASLEIGASPFAVDAQERLGQYYLEVGNKAEAVKAFEAMRDGFGWQAGVEERVESWLKTAELK